MNKDISMGDKLGITTDRITRQDKNKKITSRLTKTGKTPKRNGTLPENWFQNCEVLVGINV